MPASTRPGRRLALALMLALAALPACAIGTLHRAARREERAIALEAARCDGQRLWLIYAAEARDARDEPVGRFRRGSGLLLADLDPGRMYPVDAVPRRRVAPREIEALPWPPLPIVRPGAAPAAGPHLLVVEHEGRLQGFRVVAVAGAAPDAHLQADALTRRWLAIWTPLLWAPALAYDLVALPVLAAFAGPYFSLSK